MCLKLSRQQYGQNLLVWWIYRESHACQSIGSGRLLSDFPQTYTGCTFSYVYPKSYKIRELGITAAILRSNKVFSLVMDSNKPQNCKYPCGYECVCNVWNDSVCWLVSLTANQLIHLEKPVCQWSQLRFFRSCWKDWQLYHCNFNIKACKQRFIFHLKRM